MDERPANEHNKHHSDSKSKTKGSSEPVAAVKRITRRQTFSTVNQVLTKVVSKLGLDRRLKEQALMSLWPSVAGDALAHKSRPLFLDAENNIVVAVKDASVGQELSLRKTEMLQRLRPLARGLDVSVKGLRFDLKHFHAKTEPFQPVNTPRLVAQPTDKELSEIALTTEELAQIAELSAKLQETVDQHIQQRMLSIYEREIRLRRWRNEIGFELCPRCKEPAESFHGRDALCRHCYFEKMSKPATAGEDWT